jgi:putative transposase
VVKESIDVLGLLRKRGVEGDVDFLREAMAVLVQAIMEAEVTEQVGADYGERAPERLTQRNGYRPRPWDTRVGTLGLRIPKLREGSYFPSLLEPRRRSERALLSVIQQAYVEGVSTRRVDDLVKALGCDGISKSQVSRICQELDAVVEAFLGRPLDGGPYVYVWLDALTQKVREGGRIVNVCVVVATAVNREWRREVLGIDVGTSEDGAFWLAFLRSLVARGLGGVCWPLRSKARLGPTNFELIVSCGDFRSLAYERYTRRPARPAAITPRPGFLRCANSVLAGAPARLSHFDPAFLRPGAFVSCGCRAVPGL